MSVRVDKIVGSIQSSQNQHNNIRQSKLIKESSKASEMDSPSKKGSQQVTFKPKELLRIVEKISENVSRLNKDIKFAYSETLKSLIVKVIDVKTGKVIREIPPQEVINLQKKLSEVVGIIFDSKEVER